MSEPAPPPPPAAATLTAVLPPQPQPQRQEPQQQQQPRQESPAFFWLATVVLVGIIFVRAQAILVPLALAIIVAFALNPAVRRLERVIGRGLAVALVVLVALGAVTAFGYLLQRQLVDLSTQMTKYSSSIQRKVVALRGSEGSGLSGLSKSLDKVVRELDESANAAQGARPVRLIPAEQSAVERLGSALTPVLEPLARAVIVLVLVVFLLLKREDLRDRCIRLVGRRNITVTTRTLDDAGLRISRFLVHQSAVNGGFGVVVSVGLLVIGVPYAPLWGFVAAILRFVPFVGTFIAAFLPAALAFAQFEGWGRMLATLGLFLTLDMLAAYVVEPVVIGAKTGVSSIAMLLAAIFWAWLWGPVGLVLSTPMTVCLTVLGKYVPRLSYLAVLLGDEPALEAELHFYQRLVAGDEEEAHEILDKQLRVSPRAEVFDQLIIPALLFAERDRAKGELDSGDYEHIVRTIRALVDAGPTSRRLLANRQRPRTRQRRPRRAPRQQLRSVPR